MASTKALPDGWVEGFDSNYGRPYFFHKPTRRSSWTRPSSGEGVSDGTSQQNNESSFMDGGSSSPHPHLSASFRRSQFSNSSFQSAQSSPGQRAVTRFNEWLEVFSPEHNRTFFFNKVTRESTWVDPREMSFNERHQSGTRAAALIQTEETPAAFLSIWESVGANSSNSAKARQHQDRPISGSPFQQQQQQQQTASPVFAAASSAPFVPLQSSEQQQTAVRAAAVAPPANSPPPRTAQQQGKGGGGGADLADELEMYARDLERHQTLLHKQTVTMGGDASTQTEAANLRDEVSDLTRTAEAVLSSTAAGAAAKSSRRGMKRLLSEDSQLSIWGSEPVKVLDVKRAMQDVKSGVKYVREELKAQKQANEEAKAVDSEGGYYTILGVSTDADLEAMKKAYRRGMVKCHPDKVPPEEREKAMEKSNQLQNAYNCLTDPWERYLYDYFGLNRYLQNAKVIQCFKNYLLSGIEVIKHPRKGYPRRRFFWISPDFEWLLTGVERNLEPTPEAREKMKGVRIKDIHEITRGICTEVFARTGYPKKQSRYFSIITADRSLDIEAETKERADFLVSRISLLVLDVQKNKKWLHRHFELKALKEAATAAQKSQQDYMPKPPPDAPPGAEAQKPAAS